MPTGRQEIECDIPASSLMEVILDFQSYPTFVPEVLKVEIVEKGPPVWEVRFHLKLIRPIQYLLRLEQKNEYELHWSLIEGYFTSNNGHWILKPTQSGTHLIYQIAMQMDTFLPKAISNSLVKYSMPATVKRFVEEARKRLDVPQKNVPNDD